MQQTVQTEWAALNIKEIACPKCGVTGQLQHFGMDYRKKYHRVYCVACKRTSSELQLMQPVGAVSKPVTSSNNTLGERIDRIEDMLEKVLQGVVIKPAKAKTEPKKATFSWDDYKGTETEMKIQQLVSVLRENPKWGTVKLSRELQRLNMGLRRTIIVKVKNAFREGYFNVKN